LNNGIRRKSSDSGKGRIRPDPPLIISLPGLVGASGKEEKEEEFNHQGFL